MKRLVIRGLLVVIGCLAAGAAPAQEQPSAGHLAAAGELVDLVSGPETFTNISGLMLDGLLEMNPELQVFTGELEAWFLQVMDWEVIGPLMASIYAETFTEAEMREMIAFYGTPTGRKCVATMPELMARGAEIGNQLVMANMPELEQMITERMAEMEAGAGEEPPKERGD